MKQEIKEKWVAALRSGEYEQGKLALQREGKFCCLGVLCDIHMKETGDGKWDKTQGPKAEYHSTNGCDNSSETQLPTFVRDWSGIKDPLPNIKYEGDLRSLALLNDKEIPFNEIANLIEGDSNL